jgi:hypothetical protein
VGDISVGIIRDEYRRRLLKAYVDLSKVDKIKSKPFRWLLNIFGENVDELVKFYSINEYVPDEKPMGLISTTEDDFNQYDSREDDEAQ